MIAGIGRIAIDGYRAAIDLWRVYVATVAGVIRGLTRKGARNRGEVWRQLYSIGNRSILFIVVTLGFIGMVMTYQACLQIGRVTAVVRPCQKGVPFPRVCISRPAPNRRNT